mmetsp:Transcript_15279/g.18544  ORF Transcript_15279/g.18544 Transcript_15279/m.18544 type:complete len:323 (+) Transcript_15279:50-1018(+)
MIRTLQRTIQRKSLHRRFSLRSGVKCGTIFDPGHLIGTEFDRNGKREGLGPPNARGLSSDSFSILAPFQDSLVAFHSVTGLPWWATFACFTIGFRTSLLPLSFVARKNTEKLMSGESLKHTMHLSKLYEREVAPLRKELMLHQRNKNKAGVQSATQDLVRLTWMRIHGQFSVWKMTKVNPAWSLAMPITQSIVFIVYVLSVRDLIQSGNLDLTNQGIAWFLDLSQRDTTYLLPVLALSSTYASIEQGLRGGFLQSKKDTGIGDKIGSLFQSLLILSFPLSSQLPAAVFMYWIPSSLFGLTYLKVIHGLRRNNNQQGKKIQEK